MGVDGKKMAVPGCKIFVGGRIGEDAHLALEPTYKGIPLEDEELIPLLIKILKEEYKGVDRADDDISFTTIPRTPEATSLAAFMAAKAIEPVAKIEEKKAASAPAPVAPVAKQEEMKKAAPVSISHDEDLMLTLQVIMDHANRSSTASKEQLI